MIGTLVKYIGPSKGYVYKDFVGAHGLVVHYTPEGSDGKAHARVKWITPVEYGGRTTKYSDFRFDALQIINEVEENETTI